MNYLQIAMIFAVGQLVGAFNLWFLIRKYKRASGMNPNPLDGQQLTSMEKFVEKHKDLVREIDKATRAY